MGDLGSVRAPTHSGTTASPGCSAGGEFSIAIAGLAATANANHELVSATVAYVLLTVVALARRPRDSSGVRRSMGPWRSKPSGVEPVPAWAAEAWRGN
jgi:Kef-type K+ transport system membrane component KefB